MINTLYEFTYLPLSWQVASIASVVLLITWFQWPSIILTILTGGLLWLYGVDAQIFICNGSNRIINGSYYSITNYFTTYYDGCTGL